MKITALDHVQLAMPAGRETEARAFYEGVLGIPEVQKPPNLAKRGGCRNAETRRLAEGRGSDSCKVNPLVSCAVGSSGNPPGDFAKAPRCGAKHRRGTPCQCPAMRNGRCRLLGKLSTGARTAEGIERIRRARLKHGRYTREAMAERAEARALMRELNASIRALRG